MSSLSENSVESTGITSFAEMFSSDGLTNFFNQILFHRDKSSRLHQLCLSQMKKESVGRIQSILIVLFLMLFLMWPKDFLFFEESSISYALFYWRIVTLIWVGLALGVVSFWDRSSEYINVSFTGFCLIEMILMGVIFGRVGGFSFPWYYFAYIVPMLTVTLVFDVIKRFVVCLFLTFTYVITYTLIYANHSPEKYANFRFLDQHISLSVVSVVLGTVVGHAIYHFEYRNFFNERALQIKQQKIQKLAQYDQLTGLYNRRELESQFKQAFEQAIRYDNSLSMMIIDLDHFKDINDTHGHQTGDTVLEEFGSIISSEIRSADISGRYGGEEFCVVMPQTELVNAEKVAERLQNRLGQTSFKGTDGTEFNVTISIGIAALDDSIQSYDELLKEADTLLYHAKETGRDKIVTSDSVRE